MEIDNLQDLPDIEMSPTSDKINHHAHRYPHSLVWTPLPIITWLFPLIGHVGITNSKGVIYDFAGPYYIGEDNMGFGWPTRYFQLDMESVGGAGNWDRAVHEANTVYKGRMHNLCCDNCHSHVAYALNEMGYKGSTNWNMYSIGLLIAFRGKFLGCVSFLKTFGPFLVMLSIIVTIICLA